MLLAYLWLTIFFCVSGVLGLLAVYQIHETYYTRLPYLSELPPAIDYLAGFLLGPAAIVLFLQYYLFGGPHSRRRVITHTPMTSDEIKQQEKEEAEDKERRDRSEHPEWFTTHWD